MNIREDNITLDSLFEDLAREKVTLKEYVTRSEHSDLFTVGINKKILDGFKEHPSVYTQLFDVIKKGDGEGRTVRFPTLYGVSPEYVPELSEIPFGDMDDTATTVEAVKFGLRMGISQEMIDDNEVGLLNWTVKKLGERMGSLRDQECFKALHTYHATGASADGSVATYIGNRNRGAYYTTGAFTNGTSGSAALAWETLLVNAMDTLKNQTISFGGNTYKIPVYPDTVVVNDVRALGLRKLLNSSTIIIATGIGDTTNALVNMNAGSNLWNGMLNIVASPYCPRGGAYILKAKRGLVLLERKAPSIDKKANWAFDAQEVKATTRFMPAVIEERSIFAVNAGTAI